MSRYRKISVVSLEDERNRCKKAIKDYVFKQHGELSSILKDFGILIKQMQKQGEDTHAFYEEVMEIFNSANLYGTLVDRKLKYETVHLD